MRNTLDRTTGGIRLRRGMVLVALVLGALFPWGCASAPRGDVSAHSRPSWVAADREAFDRHASEFSAAASTVAGSVGYPGAGDPYPEQWQGFGFRFLDLPVQFASLSAGGKVGCLTTDGITLLYFETGESDYPCSDGLIYSTSATAGPDVLTSPVSVAPHWWIGAWSPFMGELGESSYADNFWAHACEQTPSVTPAARRSVSGSVAAADNVSPSSWVAFVNAGDKPLPVVVNASTKLHAPRSWGKLRSPLASCAPRRLGIGMVADIVTVDVAGGRRLDFAVEATITSE